METSDSRNDDQADVFCGREEVAEALKVPVESGRGEAYGLIVGTRKFNDINMWAEVKAVDWGGGPDGYPSFNGRPFGREVIVTSLDPDALFAVTKPEWDEIEARLDFNEPIRNPADKKEN